MTVDVNPVTVTVTDPSVVAQAVTAIKLLVGTASGGPYTAATATVPLSSLTAGAAGTYSCPFASVTFSPALSPFTTYFMVAEADNSAGVSGNSPEVSFSLVSVPSAPSGLALS